MERSLARLQTDHIDLYYAHNDDPRTPLEETLGAFGELVEDGRVGSIGASNFSAERLSEALAVSAREGLPSYVALQNEYHLLDRGYEHGAREVVASAGLGAVPYRGLAGGFLSGKYRPGGPEVDSPRAGGAAAALDERGLAVLAALDAVAGAHARPSPRSPSPGSSRSRPSSPRSPRPGASRNSRSGSPRPSSRSARASSKRSVAPVEGGRSPRVARRRAFPRLHVDVQTIYV